MKQITAPKFWTCCNQALNLIFLTDIGMPGMDGITLAANLNTSYPDIKVIILSMLDQENYIFDAFAMA